MQEANQNNLCKIAECELSISQDKQASFLLMRAISSLCSAFQDIEELLEIAGKHEEREQLLQFHQCSFLLDCSFKGLFCDIDIERAVDLPEAQYACGTQTRPDIFQTKPWSSMLSGSRKRKRDLVPNIFSEAEMVKVCKKKLNKDNMEDMELTTFLARNMMGTKASHLLPQVIVSTKQINVHWPVLPNLINLRVLRIEGKCMEASLETDGVKSLLLKLRELNKLSQSRIKEVGFWTMKKEQVGFWTMKKEFFSPRPFLFHEDLWFGIRNFENRFFGKAKYRMEYKIFQGLEQALKNTAWGKTPDYLKSIANRIEKARGKATEVFHIPVQVLVCAAIKEMEDLPVENLDWDTLEKWGVTLKYAEEFGFQVGFADNLLKTNLLAYLAYSTMG